MLAETETETVCPHMRHRAVHLTSCVAQGSVWRGQLHPWIHVEVGGKS